MQYQLIVKNGQVVTARETFRADIGVREGKIAAIGDLSGAQAYEIYDASGKYVFAGFIDEHLHSRDPGLTEKEDFAHSTLAAAAGGITTVLEMPNTVPPVMDAATFHSRAAHLGAQAFVDFAQWGLVLGDLNTPKLAEMADAGVVGFKLFWGYALHPTKFSLVYNFKKGDDVFFPPDHGQIYDAFCAIGKTGRAVAIHAEDSEIIGRLAEREAAAGANDYAAFLRSRPSFTEGLTTQAGVIIAGAAGAHLHLLHITAAEAVDAVAAARAKGQAVTGETCPHYLNTTDKDYDRLGIGMKVYPPIREQHHQDRLWAGIQNGEILTLGSDHAPHMESEKKGDIWTAPAGSSAIQTMVPQMLNHAAKGQISLNQLAALLSENPARIFGLYGQKGVIRAGADGDLTIVDMEKTVSVTREQMLSKNKESMLQGAVLQGAPVAVFLRGKQIMQDGQPMGERLGQLVKPGAKAEARW
jgi:allantoinase